MDCYQKLLSEHLLDKKIIGLGSGSKMRFIADSLPPTRGKSYIPTSVFNGRIFTPGDVKLIPTSLDLYVEYADVFIKTDDDCDYFIKGYENTPTKEKLYYAMAQERVVFYDSKTVKSSLKGVFIPLEIIKESYYFIKDLLNSKGLKHKMKMNGASPFITESGNFLLQVEYNETFFRKCNNIPGVIEHGLFKITENTTSHKI